MPVGLQRAWGGHCLRGWFISIINQSSNVYTIGGSYQLETCRILCFVIIALLVIGATYLDRRQSAKNKKSSC